MAAIAAGIGLGTIAGIFNGAKNCDSSKENKCYPRYISGSSGACAGDTGEACLGGKMILPQQSDGYGNSNDYPNSVFQVEKSGGPDTSHNQIMLNPNYLSACYSEEVPTDKNTEGAQIVCSDSTSKASCPTGKGCQWEPAYTQNGQPQDGKCVNKTTSNLLFMTNKDGKVDTNVLPQYEATDRCWYNDNPNSADCAKVDTTGKIITGSRVANSALCQNQTVCINNNVIPNPFKKCKKEEASNNEDCSFYVKDTPCQVGADVENNGCIKGYSCRSGYINANKKYTADAPQPWMKYISRPKCNFVTPQPSNSTNGWKTFGSALAGMVGFNVGDAPMDKAKASLKAAQDSINSITANNSIDTGEEGLKDLKVFRQSLQVQQKELLMLSSNATEMLSWKVEKNTLYFNLIAIVVCVLILFELI